MGGSSHMRWGTSSYNHNFLMDRELFSVFGGSGYKIQGMFKASMCAVTNKLCLSSYVNQRIVLDRSQCHRAFRMSPVGTPLVTRHPRNTYTSSGMCRKTCVSIIPASCSVSFVQ